MLAAGVGRSRVLRRLTLDRNGLGAAGGAALAAALLGHEACALVSLSAAGAFRFLARARLTNTRCRNTSPTRSTTVCACLPTSPRQPALPLPPLPTHHAPPPPAGAGTTPPFARRCHRAPRAPDPPLQHPPPPPGGNELGASAPALAAALPSCRALRRLQLPRNDVDDGGGVALCEAFAAHPALRELDLSSNIITALPIETQVRCRVSPRGHISATSRPHLGCISAVSRLFSPSIAAPRSAARERGGRRRAGQRRGRRLAARPVCRPVWQRAHLAAARAPRRLPGVGRLPRHAVGRAAGGLSDPAHGGWLRRRREDNLLRRRHVRAPESSRQSRRISANLLSGPHRLALP